MATDRAQPGNEPFNDGDDARLAWLLTARDEAPPLRSEFADELARQLDMEFAALHSGRAGQNVAGLNVIGAPSSNGHCGVGHASSDRRRPRRWKFGVAAAAILLMAAAVASDPPAWANIVRGLVNRIGELAGRGQREHADRGDAAATVLVDVPIGGGGEGSPAATLIDPETEIVVVEVPAEVESAPAPRARTRRPRLVATGPPWAPLEAPLAPGELSQRVDELLARQWNALGIHPAEPATDAEFMRRVYLDLTGRIPTVNEARTFLEDKLPHRRERLVDSLLGRRDHATHLAAVWRSILLPADVDLAPLGGAVKFDEWLAERFGANMPYDHIVRDLLLAQGRVSESGPLLFYAAARLNPDELAARTSRAFLGVRMECAQCHDHPFDEVSQHDFWSFAAFFARISRPEGKMEMTSPVLQVRDSEHGDVLIPDSDEIVPPRLPLSAGDADDAPDGPSRRRQLAEWLTAPGNGQFARATVNRVWAHLFGRGLVEPVDDMRPDNEPVCPEVLDMLSRDFAASGFDLRRLMAELVMTRAYQLSSKSADDDPSRLMYFAQMNIKSFTAELLYDCIAVAAGRAAATTEAPGGAGLVRTADMTRQAFIEQFRAPPGQATDYQAGIPQALTLMHGGLTHSAADAATSGLLKSISAPFFTDAQRLDALFLATLSRFPEPAERTAILVPLAAAKDDGNRRAILGDALWALLNCAEFTLNH